MKFWHKVLAKLGHGLGLPSRYSLVRQLGKVRLRRCRKQQPLHPRDSWLLSVVATCLVCIRGMLQKQPVVQGWAASWRPDQPTLRARASRATDSSSTHAAALSRPPAMRAAAAPHACMRACRSS